MAAGMVGDDGGNEGMRSLAVGYIDDGGQTGSDAMVAREMFDE
jgi:hypothetical protein